MLKLQFINTFKEERSANHLYQAHYGRSGIGRIVAIFCGLLGLLSLINFGLGFASIALLAMTPLWWTNWRPITDLAMLLVVQLDRKRRNAFALPRTLTIDERGIKYVTSDSEAETLWTEYQKAIENPRLFLLIKDKDSYSIIPKRAFPDLASLKIFRALIQQKISNHSLAPTAL